VRDEDPDNDHALYMPPSPTLSAANTPKRSHISSAIAMIPKIAARPERS
jgi:hypothetical protein